uniref:TNFR-Cys domain-containing protein n=1 Tax=Oreochromis aureus TaxID=47969 RepID=A0A668RGP3_OREAU
MTFQGVIVASLPALDPYRIGNECCPKCLAGSRVKTHCNEYRSTSCVPCADGTFTKKPNGLDRCTPCTNCHSTLGLKLKKQCTTTSDTLCEPLEGFYCEQLTGHSCTKAREHKRCKPGQRVSQKGTALTDTKCSDCSDGTLYNGTLDSCQPHTQCHFQQLTPGTPKLSLCGTCSSHMYLVCCSRVRVQQVHPVALCL